MGVCLVASMDGLREKGLGFKGTLTAAHVWPMVRRGAEQTGGAAARVPHAPAGRQWPCPFFAREAAGPSKEAFLGRRCRCGRYRQEHVRYWQEHVCTLARDCVCVCVCARARGAVRGRVYFCVGPGSGLRGEEQAKGTRAQEVAADLDQGLV